MMRRRCSALVLALPVVLGWIAGGPLVAQENWPRFRGPGGQGVSQLKGLPVSWTQSDYSWIRAVPGEGHSSPCVWGDHVFVTTAEKDGRTRMLLNLHADTGEIKWSRSTPSETHEIHQLNSYASATPAADARRVYVLFASDKQLQVLAYDHAGNPVWSRDLGPFIQKESQVHGAGTSPIVFEDQVIVANQQDGESAIISLDAATGVTRWTQPRNLRLTGHSTPLVYHTPGQDPLLLITNTGDGYAALDPRTGALRFRADILSARCVGSPIVSDGLMFATCGGGGRGKYLAAFPLDLTGDLTAESARWTKDRNLPYVPTPIAFNHHLFLWGDNGVVSCLDARTGKEMWTERVGGNFSGSPVCVDGKLYAVSHSGTVVVLNAGPEFAELGRSELGEGCHSTPAVAGGRMFLRGFEHVFCLKAETVIGK